eukprot:jgi/Bigna1/69774/fgenesh1_pg.10_\
MTCVYGRNEGESAGRQKRRGPKRFLVVGSLLVIVGGILNPPERGRRRINLENKLHEASSYNSREARRSRIALPAIMINAEGSSNSFLSLRNLRSRTWEECGDTRGLSGGAKKRVVVHRYGDAQKYMDDLDDVRLTGDFEWIDGYSESSNTIEEVEESRTVISESEVVEVLRSQGCDKPYDPYQKYGLVREHFKEAVKMRFDLTEYEVIELIDQMPRIESQLDQIITHCGERINFEEQGELLRLIKDILGAVVKEAEEKDPHSLSNYAQREIYQVASLHNGKPTGEWLRFLSLANKVQSDVPAQYIRAKPTPKLWKMYILEESRKTAHPFDPETLKPYINDTLWKNMTKARIFCTQITRKAGVRAGYWESDIYMEKHEALRKSFANYLAHFFVHALNNSNSNATAMESPSTKANCKQEEGKAEQNDNNDDILREKKDKMASYKAAATKLEDVNPFTVPVPPQKIEIFDDDDDDDEDDDDGKEEKKPSNHVVVTLGHLEKKNERESDNAIR